MIFVDTSPLIDLLTERGNWKRISRFMDAHESELCTSMIVLSELKFKLLFYRASVLFGTNKKFEVVHSIKTNKRVPAEVYRKYMGFYAEERMKVFGLLPEYELLSCSLGIKYSLLPNDALILATMVKNDIGTILTDDNDFKKIDKIRVIEP